MVDGREMMGSICKKRTVYVKVAFWICIRLWLERFAKMKYKFEFYVFRKYRFDLV
jgi:hypothetical protein